MLDVTNKKQGFYLRNLVQVADYLRAIPESVEDDGSITHYPTATEGNLMKSHSYGVVFEYLLAFRANAGSPIVDTAEITRLTQENTELKKRLESLPTPSNDQETLQLQEKIDSLTLSNTGLTKDLEDGRNQYQQVLDTVKQRDERIEELEAQVRQLTQEVSNLQVPELEKVRQKFERVTQQEKKPRTFTLSETYNLLVTKFWKAGKPYPI